ncbi:hypothetical protein OOK31_25555 [Streptomyces sp. NBC_00249]|uniref:hypothetical protein n=1 Tax=Streptomyces sp. NBC_00249 TaxID=2975690 RepID=UPI002251F0EA|nr:hypothetical protein [Streptomyces sp. NBC_00249]MCX5197224.1 hypothetical protein [Streptomyces sp. NBC_00249]
MARIYATAEQYEAYTYAPAPTDIEYRLARASEFLDSQVLRLCRYEVTDAGLPSDTVVAAAVARAVCAQVQWGVEVGDVTGAAGVGYGSVEIGSVKLSRSVTAVSGDDSPGRQIAPAVWDALRSPDLTPDRWQLGAVSW